MTGIAFRAWMKATRGRLGLTQEEVGDLCSPRISGGRIGDIERGVRVPSTGEALEIRAALEKAADRGR